MIDNLINFFKNLKNKKLILGFIILGLIIYAVFIITVLLLINRSSNPSVVVTPGDLNQDYSRLNQVKPGEASLNDVKKVNGEPESVSTIGDKTYMRYKTPLEGFENTVAIQNDKVVYSTEKVFGSYRGSVADFKTKYGEPDLSLFGDNYSWYVYLDEGVAVQNDGRDIGTILYFVPQTKEKFMSTLARELGLTETPTIEE